MHIPQQQSARASHSLALFFYLIFLRLDEEFGRGDTSLIRRGLILEKKRTITPPLLSVCTHAATNIVLPLSDNNTIQFQGTRHFVSIGAVNRCVTVCADQPAPGDKSHTRHVTAFVVVFLNHHINPSSILIVLCLDVKSSIINLELFSTFPGSDTTVPVPLLAYP